MKTIEAILKHNSAAYTKIDALKTIIAELESEIVSPCGHCRHEGTARCEACMRSRFGEFNLKEYL